MGVALGGTQAAVAEKGLDMTNIGTVVQHVGGGTVPQEVACSGFGDAGLDEVAAYQTRKRTLTPVGMALARQEKVAGVGISGDFRASLVEVAQEPIQGGPANGHHAVFAVLALIDPNPALGVIEVVKGQTGQLHFPQARAVEGFQNGPHANAVDGG